MVFRDQKRTCEVCGEVFFFTVTEQRRIARETGSDEIEPPTRCPRHREQAAAALRAAPEPVVAERPAVEPRPAPERPRPEPRPEPERPRVEPRPEPVQVRAASQPLSEVFPLEEEGVEVKLIGTVKWFSREKGYGFVTKADGEDLFFHRTDMSKEERNLPHEGQRIEFQIRQTEKGPEAFNVSILPED